MLRASARGAVFGNVYSPIEVNGVCPWCIADGSAAAKWNAQFTDGDFRDRHFERVELSKELHDEVFLRTPGVIGALQPISWWAHCQQPAAFLRLEDDRVCFQCIECGKKFSYRDQD